MNTKLALKKIISLLLLIYLTPVNAAWYQVEVVVFDYLSPDFDGELWYENPGLPDRNNSVELVTELAQLKDEVLAPEVVDTAQLEMTRKKADLVPYLRLDGDVLRLEGVQRVLLLSRDYRPQLHVAWQQPGLESRQAKAVHLHKFGELEESFSNEESSDDVFDLEALLSQTPMREDVYKLLNLIFEGTIQLRSSTFLHVDVDMAYFPEYFRRDKELIEENINDVVEKRADYVRLKESRKIRLNEIHYFDHPLFGIILRVSRLKRN